MNHIRPLRASMVVPVIVVLLAACSGTSSPTAATGASGSTEAPASGPATAAISPTPPSSTNPVAVLPGEPWIAYEGPVPEVGGVGIRVIRPNGRDEHWATPEAPITHNPGASGGGLGDGWQLQPDWSPDGGRIAFVVDTWPAKPSTRDLWVSNADGTGTRRVYQCVSPCSVAQFPAWSPDGTSLLFVRWDRTDRGVDGSVLQRLDLASGTATMLAATTGPEYFFFPRWSPDGASVVHRDRHVHRHQRCRNARVDCDRARGPHDAPRNRDAAHPSRRSGSVPGLASAPGSDRLPGEAEG